jgi:hypothetical protein
MFTLRIGHWRRGAVIAATVGCAWKFLNADLLLK